MHVGGLRRLKWLLLTGTKVSDPGMEHLKVLTELKALNLGNTHVTKEGIEELRKALPNCEIIWEEETAQPPTN